MRHGSLFSGIGGFDLAASWMGWDNIFHCEKDAFCKKVLKHYWPQAQSYEDIYQFNATGYRGYVDIISGGFPCQPFSSAGRRKGKADDRYLWPEARRVIMEAQPEWIVLENVAGLFTILERESLSALEVKAVELFCSDSEQEANATIIRLQRRIIGNIISEIRSAGYILPQLEDGTPVVLCIPACAVNAPHRRDRVWFVAHAEHLADRPDHDRRGDRRNIGENKQGRQPQATVYQGRADHDSGKTQTDTNGNGYGQHRGDRAYEIYTGERGQYACHDPQQVGSYVTDPNGKGLEGATGQRIQGFGRKPAWGGQIPGWAEWPAQSPVCGGNDGLPLQLDGITFSKWRRESIKAYGNAIVPQIAFELFSSIAATNKI